MASAVEFADSNGLDANHHLHCIAYSSYSKLEELAREILSKFRLSVWENRTGFGRPHSLGTRPWPELPLRNHDHTEVAVVIIGGGISSTFKALVHDRRKS
jgi:hypothetical protein